MTRRAPRETTNGNGLRQLLDLEAELGEKLEAARRDAEAIRAEAERAAQTARKSGESEMATEEEALKRRFQQWIESESRRIREEVSRKKHSLESTPTSQLDTIARELLASITNPVRETDP